MKTENNLQTNTKKKSFLKRNWWKLLILLIFILAALFIYFMFPIAFYLPHKKPVLILPIEQKYDSIAGIMPMGEKINHPNAPSGHPGIDFGFPRNDIPYIAAMDGIVTKVRVYENKEEENGNLKQLTKAMVDVVITEGTYQTVYSEMDAKSLPSSIKTGAKIKQGKIVGYGNTTKNDTNGDHEMIHWEFGSTSPLIDRFCPLSYFTPDSKQRIEAIWGRQSLTDMGGMKAEYPKICNGDYDGKYER